MEDPKRKRRVAGRRGGPRRECCPPCATGEGHDKNDAGRQAGDRQQPKAAPRQGAKPQGQDRLSLAKISGLGSRAPGQRLQARALRIVVGAHGSWMTATRCRGATAKPAATNGTLRQQQRGRSTDAAPHESLHALSAHRRASVASWPCRPGGRSLYRRPPTRAYGRCADLSRVRGRAQVHLRWPDLAFPLELLHVKAHTRCDLESDPFNDPTGGSHKGAVEFVELSLFSRGECDWESGPRTGNRLITSFRLGSFLKAFW